jgi:immune inhibitor A
MATNTRFLKEIVRVFASARAADDGHLCAVSPHPDLRQKINEAVSEATTRGNLPAHLRLRASEPKAYGLNDGMIVPPEAFPLGTSPAIIRAAAAERAPLRGTVRVVVVLVDFADRQMAQTQNHFRDLFFSLGTLPTRSVREYYREVTNNLVDIQGDVVGPFRMPQTLAAYAHGASGMGNVLPNARTMANDAVTAANASVNFDPYDNDGNGFVDAFIVIHAGPGAEVTGSSGDIWSHKWVLDGGARSVDHTKIYGYLTVPEDCRIGVCAHELGHLLFGFPDLYDTDGSSEGIGDWCLMASGSWGAGGNTPCHPSAWCKANQGWVSIDSRTTNATLSIPDVKASQTVYRLWKDGAAGNEYFLLENRQPTGFDASLPGGGLLIWHVDEAQQGNTDESHYKVGLLQADGRRDLERNANRGDGGDSYPGSANNSALTDTSNPSSRSFANAATCVSVTGISAPGPVMTATVHVRCIKIKDIEKDHIQEKLRKDVKDRKEHKEIKEKDRKDVKEKDFKERKEFKEKELKEIDKPIRDDPGKPVIDKSAGLDKGFDNKLADGKFGDQPGLPGRVEGGDIEARVAALEAVVAQLATQGPQEAPFIGAELRPDLSQSPFMGEQDQLELQQQMKLGSAQAKRVYDAKPGR